MLAKVRFLCEKCGGHIDAGIDGKAYTLAPFVRSIQAQGWKVVGDQNAVTHFCPDCEAQF